MANTDIHPAFSLSPIYHEVVIIGAGISGICMGAQLKRKFGVTDIVILEKEDGIAGYVAPF
jgi:cation diffusion facilitator CzcD-associated flavoprotein CzcO